MHWVILGVNWFPAGTEFLSSTAIGLAGKLKVPNWNLKLSWQAVQITTGSAAQIFNAGSAGCHP
jgi:hypothetical protein